MGDIRIGRISSVNYAAGTARVVYSDRDNSVTQEFPICCVRKSIKKVAEAGDLRYL